MKEEKSEHSRRIKHLKRLLRTYNQMQFSLTLYKHKLSELWSLSDKEYIDYLEDPKQEPIFKFTRRNLKENIVELRPKINELRKSIITEKNLIKYLQRNGTSKEL